MPVDLSHFETTSFNPFVNLIQQSNPPQRVRCRPHPQRSGPRHLYPRTESTKSDSASFVIHKGRGSLRQEHEPRVHASHIFGLQISQSHIRFSVACLENDMAVARDSTCSCCGILVPSTDIRRFLDGDPFLRLLEGLCTSSTVRLLVMLAALKLHRFMHLKVCWWP